MPKCHDENFLGLYAAICEDILAYEPSLRLDLERDLSRINSSIATRGVGVFLRDLPELGKILDQALSSGRLMPSSLAFSKGYVNGSPIPRLFKGIWLRVFRKNGVLRQDIDSNFVFFLRTLLYCGKKYEFRAPDASLYAATREFYVDDESLPPSSQIWDTDGSSIIGGNNPSNASLTNRPTDQYDLFGSVSGADTKLLDTIQRVADIVSTSFGEFIPSTGKYKNGPGAVSERLRGMEKFLPTRWSDRLNAFFPPEGNSIPLGWDSDHSSDEICSRLISVPKTIKTPRLIAAEPSDHLWNQFSIMEYFYDKVSSSVCRFSINYRDQEPSKILALSSSLSGDFATIDLKSASDRISCWLVERIFRANGTLLGPMIACRTRYVDLNLDRKLPSLHKLRKFTTQGSALTFPVQSIVFFCIIVGSQLVGKRVTRKTIEEMGKQVRIFGDDIIVPKDWFAEVKYSLEALYLKVNAKKTHFSGNFRESCGMDAFCGDDVTPPYISTFPSEADQSDLISVIECSNNFFLKGLWHAAAFIESTIPKQDRKYIPIRKKSDCSLSLRSFSGNSLHRSVKERWNSDYQTRQYKIMTQKVKIRRIAVEGSRHLAAFLAERCYRDVTPFLGGYDPFNLLSRWESRPIVGWEWVDLGN